MRSGQNVGVTDAQRGRESMAALSVIARGPAVAQGEGPRSLDTASRLIEGEVRQGNGWRRGPPAR